MRKGQVFLGLFLLTVIFTAIISAQTNTDVGIKPNLAGGEVTSITEGKIILTTKDGIIEIVLSPQTIFKRVPPENPTLKAAVDSSLSEIGEGDKLLVTGMVSENKKTLPAKAVYLITKSDIIQKQTKEQREWQTRGISGKVVTFNPQTNVITVSVRGLIGERNVSVKTNEKTEFFRYTEDSVKFSDAKRSNIGEIELGDAIRVLGDRNADGSEMVAEKIVTGSFQTVGGTIKSINPQTNEIVISDFQTKKDVTIMVSEASVLKQFPAEMAQRMAQFQMGGGQGQGGFRPPMQPGNQPNPQQNQQMPNGLRGGGGGIDDMLDRFPNIKISDLKVGEMIAVSSTRNKDTSRIRAIKLLSGVEPFLRMAQSGGNRGNGRGGMDSGFTIPGLDGFGGF
jgi:ribosomal protein L24